MADEIDDFLAHYGVKGMKWGVNKAASGISAVGSSINAGVKDAVQRSKEKRDVKKAERKANFDAAQAAGYSSKMRARDIQDVGKRGVRRIEKRIANGERINRARFKESAASTARGFAVGAAILATPIAVGAASEGLSSLSKHINAKRGAEAAAKLFADSKGLTSYKTVSLAFNAATGAWE